RLTGNIYAELKFLKHLTFRTSFGGDFGQAEVRSYIPKYEATVAQRATISRLGVDRTETRNWIIENTLTYDNTWNENHKLTFLLGQTAQRYRGYTMNAVAQNVP